MNHMRQAHMVTPLVSYFSLGPSFPTHMDTHTYTLRRGLPRPATDPGILARIVAPTLTTAARTGVPVPS